MFGIIIGASSVFIIVSAGESAQNFIYHQIRSLGSNLVGVLPGKSSENGPPAAVYGIITTTLRYEDAVALTDGPNAVQHLIAATGYTRGQNDVNYKNKSVNVPLNGVMASYPQVIDHVLDEGRFFNHQEEKNLSKVVVLGSQVKLDLFNDQNPVSEMVKIGNEKFKIIGYFKPKGVVAFQNLDNQVYLPVITMQKIISGTNYLTAIRAKVDKDIYVDDVIEEIRRKLRVRHHIVNRVTKNWFATKSGALGFVGSQGTACEGEGGSEACRGVPGGNRRLPPEDDFTVLSAEKALSAITNVTNIIKFVLAAVAAIAFIVGGVGVMNMMYVNVTERTSEIGLRKALGAHYRDILFQFLLEALIITVSGGILGVMLGFLLIMAVSFGANAAGYSINIDISLTSFAFSFFVTALFSLLFGIGPASKAAKLQPVIALSKK